VTSLERLLGRTVEVEAVERAAIKAFSEVFARHPLGTAVRMTTVKPLFT
jgi:hypothetical protein